MSRNDRSWIWIAVAVLFVSMGAIAFKTRSEVIKRPTDAWGAGLRETLLSHMASDNPGHMVLNPKALEQGRMEYLPTPAPTTESDLMAVWQSDAQMTWRTRNSRNENGDDFANRAGRDFTAMLRVFPKR